MHQATVTAQARPAISGLPLRRMEHGLPEPGNRSKEYGGQREADGGAAQARFINLPVGRGGRHGTEKDAFLARLGGLGTKAMQSGIQPGPQE